MGHMTFPESHPKPASHRVMKLGSPLLLQSSFPDESVRKKEYLCCHDIYPVPSVHAWPMSDDARTSIWAFGEVVCFISEVSRAQAGFLSLHKHRISLTPSGLIVLENQVLSTCTLGRHILGLVLI